MTLNAIFEALTEVMDLEESPDPLHNLRGVLTKGVKDGWLERPERGVYRLARETQPKVARKIAAPGNGSAAPVVVVQSREPRARRRRRGKKSLEIMVGDITLRTPSGMQPETLARIVQAIRAASN